MRIPLLIAGCSSEVSPCEVFLFEGNWEVVIEGLVDSKLYLSLSQLVDIDIVNGTKLTIAEASKVKLYFEKVGTEKSISVYVNKC